MNINLISHEKYAQNTQLFSFCSFTKKKGRGKIIAKSSNRDDIDMSSQILLGN